MQETARREAASGSTPDELRVARVVEIARRARERTKAAASSVADPRWTFERLAALWQREMPPQPPDETTAWLLSAYLLGELTDVTWPTSGLPRNDKGEYLALAGYRANPNVNTWPNSLVVPLKNLMLQPIMVPTKHPPQEPITRDEWRRVLSDLDFSGFEEGINLAPFKNLANIPLSSYRDDSRFALRSTLIDCLQVSESALRALCEEHGRELPAFLRNSHDPTAHAHQASPPEALPSHRYSSEKLTCWYRDTYVPDAIAEGRKPSIKDDVQAARSKFGVGVPRDAVREMRRLYPPAAWHKRGPSKKVARKGGGKKVAATSPL